MIQEIWNQLIEFTAKLVVPDWGALVALIPVALLLLGVLYLVWVVRRFASAGPARRGKRRLSPVAPSDIHMPGPSFAPVLGAIGVFFLGFGLVAGGLWLIAGSVILVLTLLYWGREALRDYDASASGHGGDALIIGALPAPSGAPPAGVHIPAPSFRPLLVAFAMTILVAGLVLGGWALILGFIAVVVTTLGWLWDARKEYVAVEEADITGHLDAGGNPSWPKATFAALGAIVVVALVLSSNLLPNSGGDAVPSGGPAPAPGSGAPPPQSAPPAIDADAVLTAKGTAWVETTLTVPAGQPFTLAMDNQDALPHDVQLKDAGGTEVFRGAVVVGPAVEIYDVPTLPAGQYTYICTIHPNMTGTATAQ